MRALWRDDRTQAPLTVDLRINSERRVVSVWDVFGAFDLDGPDCRPFVLRRDGALQFAAPPHWRTDLRAARIEVGARFTVHWNDADSGEYEIVKVAALGAKDQG